MGWIVWDPERVCFAFVTWYGVLFAFGLACAYFVLRLYLQRELALDKQEATKRLDRLIWILVPSMLVGARLVHCLIYEWSFYQAYPMELFKVWHGGLASHGGVAGLLLATLFCRKLVPLLRLWDGLALVAPLVAGFIRVGNFINQEILGRPTEVPWAVIFPHPLEPLAVVPRHPVQLYEALSYFMLFALICCLYRAQKFRHPGRLCGFFLVMVFSLRFLLEFFKAGESSSALLIGQYLSIPFISLGLGLLLRTTRKEQTKEV